MAMEPLILIANPGSASRKYALFEGEHKRAQLHFEPTNSGLICTLQTGSERRQLQTDLRNLSETAGQVIPLLRAENVLQEDEHVRRIALRLVAPSGYFLEDRVIDDDVLARLEALLPRAPLHISASLQELKSLRSQFDDATIVGISDSAYHITKPDYAWNYGISLDDADRLDIKRFGYHGLAVASAVHALKTAHKLPPKVVVCHLGSGVSVTAVHGGKSVDTTMGYSPLEGPVMATRSGSIDPAAVRALRDALKLDDVGIETYLNQYAGLLGLGGASDFRELLAREEQGDHRAHLALNTYVFTVQKAIGQMSAALGGLDLLAFTGTVGERSAIIRERILQRFHYLDLFIDKATNGECTEPAELTIVSRLAHSKPICVIPTDEASEMARRTANL